MRILPPGESITRYRRRTISLEPTSLIGDSNRIRTHTISRSIGNHSSRQTFALEESHIFTPTLINTARFGFNRDVVIAFTTLSAINPAAADTNLGFNPGLPVGIITVGSGVTQFSGGLGAISAYRFHFNSFQAYDDLFWTRNKHSLKFGFYAERIQANQFTQGAESQRLLHLWVTVELLEERTHYVSNVAGNIPHTAGSSTECFWRVHPGRLQDQAAADIESGASLRDGHRADGDGQSTLDACQFHRYDAASRFAVLFESYIEKLCASRGICLGSFRAWENLCSWCIRNLRRASVALPVPAPDVAFRTVHGGCEHASCCWSTFSSGVCFPKASNPTEPAQRICRTESASQLCRTVEFKRSARSGCQSHGYGGLRRFARRSSAIPCGRNQRHPANSYIRRIPLARPAASPGRDSSPTSAAKSAQSSGRLLRPITV